MGDPEPRETADDEERRVRDAEVRLEARLEVVEKAHAEGRLEELAREVPPVREQLRPYLDAPA